MLKLENVTYSYNHGEFALNNISVCIGVNEKIAILGENGSGKSTFFLICNGVLIPDSGSVYFNGNKITGKKKDLNILRKNLGIVFQNPDSQIIAQDVFSEVSFGVLNINGNKDEVRKKCEDALKKMNLTNFYDRPPHLLSEGEKKRVCIADVIAMEPQIIFFDEPTASLDSKNTVAFEDTVNELYKESVSTVISTHDVDFAYKWADRILVFSKGKLIADNLPNAIFMDEEIVKAAFLKKPYVFEISEVLKESGIINKDEFPRSLAELKLMVGASK